MARKTVKTRRGLALERNREKWLATRARNINSSEVGALFGLSPYMTPLELFALKTGQIEDSFTPNDRTIGGQFLEPAIAAWAQEKFGFKAKPFKDYLENPKLKTGSSYDWQVTEWMNAPGSMDGRIPLEIKCVDFRVFHGTFKAGYVDRKWNADNADDIQAPAHIELQLQHQMLQSGAAWGVILVLIAGNDLRMIVRMRNESIGRKIEARIQQFWEDVSEGRQPGADYERDAETIKRLYARPDPRASIDPANHGQLMDAIARATDAAEEKKAAASVEETAKAEVMDVMRECELAILPDQSKVSWKADKNGRRSLRLTAAAAAMEQAA
jgi:putative phage-type endonuclease